MKRNLMTLTMDKVANMLSGIDSKLANMGVYGVEKATRTEKRKMAQDFHGIVENMSATDWANAINRFGSDEVRHWVEDYMMEYKRWQ